MVKTRFAPSPTGHIHMGNARTALFSALLAKHHQGAFLLRIEDTDLARSTVAFQEALQADLKWLGVEWQEGPEVGGPHSPYLQSQRGAIYEHYYQQLQNMGRAYPCFCSEVQLAVSRKVQLASGQPPRYTGTCRHLSEAEREQKISQGLKPTLRFLVPKDAMITFEDGVRGVQQFAADDIGDFIIRRADGTSSFMFCNAIDDAVMSVTHVVRGEDHLTNTPRQLMILEALQLPKPHYSHIAMILGQDGSPLSKRNGSRSIQQLRTEGFLPIAVMNYMARLGHYYVDNRLMTVEELAASFAMKNLGKAAARFDENQLSYWQKTAVLAATDETLWQWMGAAVHTLVPHEQRAFFIQTIRDNVVFPAQALEWAKIFFDQDWTLAEENQQVLRQSDKRIFQVAVVALQDKGADFKAMSERVSQDCGVKGKALFQPLRLALTGQSHGPHMANVVELMGVAECERRLAMWT